VAFAYLIVTPLGGKILLGYFKQQFVSVGLMHVGHYEGNLQNGFILKDVRIRGLCYLPDALLRIQEVDVLLPLWDPLHSDVSIFNARVLIPDSDPVVFTGDVYAGQVKGELYAKSLNIHEASRFWTTEDIRKNVRGYISDIDFKVQGPLFSPRVNGPFLADSIQYKSVVLTNGASNLNLVMMLDRRQVQIKGEIIVNSGFVKVRNTDLQVSSSKIIYQKDISNPRLDIHLGAKVEDMDIHLAIKGDLDRPQLIVSSDPPMPPQDALRVLFTGNAWVSSTSPFNGVSSTQLAQDFLNYSLEDIDDQQQFGLKTKLTDNLKLGVEMDQIPSPPGETNTYYSRKIEGEMDMNNHMSLNISKEVLPQDRDPSQSVQGAEQDAETQIYLLYKKRF
jgi:hypothetical protein